MSLVKRSSLPPPPHPPSLALDGHDIVIGTLLALFAFAVAWHAFGFSYIAFDAPLVYMGDALYYQYLYEATFEGGWLGTIERAGAPLGTSQFDFPNVDGFNLLLMQAGELAGGGPFVAFNTHVLLTFPICAAVAYAVNRRLGLDRAWAVVAALAFTMLPFHFQRLGHLFFLAYFCAAIAAWLALEIVTGRRTGNVRKAPFWLILVGAVVCGTCGVYFAFFSCLFVLVVAAHASAIEGGFQPLRRGALVCCLIVSASAVNLAPTFWHLVQEGRNPSVAARAPLESEIYGLKLTQLLMPRDGHRIPALGNLRAAYESGAPLSNENRTASLGMFGAFGFVALLLVPFGGRLRRHLPDVVRASAAPAYAGLLYATIGGAGSLFALLVSPQLRGLNRISPFLGFFGILCTAALLSAVARSARPRMTLLLTWVAAPILAACILIDQVSYGGAFWKPIHAELMHRFERDRNYYREVERVLGHNAMVMQLPLMKYPEAPLLKQMGSYDSLAAILHTDAMHWTAGAMTGRAAERWQRLFEIFPTAEKVRALAALGFAGVDLDVRGLGEERPAIVADLELHGLRRVAASADEQNILLAVPDTQTPDQRAMAVIPASGWSTMESASGEAWWWAAGDASLEVGNISAEPRACYLELTIESYLVPRTVSLWEEGRKLAEQHMQPSMPTRIAATLEGSTRIRRLTLRTDAPPHSVEGDSRLLAYRLVTNGIPLCR